MDTPRKNFCSGKKCFFIPFLIIGFLGISAVVMLLWNWILPSISSLQPLTYWQSMGIFALSRILFGGFHFGNHHRMHKHHFGHPELKDKLMEMDDDEKRQFKEHWKSRFCNK
jgi:hypothetical protein